MTHPPLDGDTVRTRIHDQATRLRAAQTTEDDRGANLLVEHPATPAPVRLRLLIRTQPSSAEADTNERHASPPVDDADGSES